MQWNVVRSYRVYSIFLSIILFNFCVVANTAELEVTGYSTLLGSYTDSNNGVAYDSGSADKYLNFTHNSRAGIQFNSKINKEFDFSLTLLMEGRNDFQAKADWFYATYSASEDFQVRFGRLKVPFYMVSNYIDIGNAYPWVAPPQEVYSTNLIKSADGIELVYDTLTSGGTNFLLEIYFGSSKTEDILSPAIVASDTAKYKTGDKIVFDADNLLGVEGLVSTGSFTLRAGYYNALIDSKDFNLSGERTTVASVGVIIDWLNFVLYSEYVSRDSSDKTDVLFADQKASYITLGYRFGKFLPYIMSAKLEGGVNESIHSLRQTSIGGGFKYELSDSTDFKLEVLSVTPTSRPGDTSGFGLFAGDINDTSANVYAMSFDVLF